MYQNRKGFNSIMSITIFKTVGQLLSVILISAFESETDRHMLK